MLNLREVGFYIKCMIPSLIGWSLMEVNRSYLVSLDRFDVPAKLLILSCATHLVSCYILIGIFKYELAGAALSNGVTDIVTGVLMSLHVKYKDPYP